MKLLKALLFVTILLVPKDIPAQGCSDCLNSYTNNSYYEGSCQGYDGWCSEEDQYWYCDCGSILQAWVIDCASAGPNGEYYCHNEGEECYPQCF